MKMRVRPSYFLFFFLIFFISPFLSSQLSAQKIWTLEDCINFALENNLDVNKQILTVESNKKTLVQSGLNMLPNLNANGTNIWNFGQTIDQYTNTFATTTVRSNNFYIASNVVLFGGLQKFNTFKANKISLEASKFDLDVIRNNISLSVAGYYLDILFNSELLEVAREQLRITTAESERISKKVEAGSSARGDLLNISAQKAAEELNVIDAQNKLTISNISLQQLIDLPVTRDFKVEKPALKPVSSLNDTLTTEVIFEKAKLIRPEIRAAELRVDYAQKRLAVARGYIQPVLSLSGSWGTGYSGAAQEVDPGVPADTIWRPVGITVQSKDLVLMPQVMYSYRIKAFDQQLLDNSNQSVGFSLNVPIFNGWQGRNAINQAKIQKSQSEIDLDIRLRDLRKIIEQAYADAVSSFQRYNASKDKVTAQQEAFKYAQQKFEVGMMTSFDYNNSKKDLTKAESELLQAKFDFIFKTTILDFYMGNPIRIDRE